MASEMGCSLSSTVARANMTSMLPRESSVVFTVNNQYDACIVQFNKSTRRLIVCQECNALNVNSRQYWKGPPVRALLLLEVSGMTGSYPAK